MKRQARWTLAATLAVAALVASCSDGTGPSQPVPTRIVPEVTGVTFTALGQSDTLVVTVLDQNAVEMPGATISWASSASAVAAISSGGVVTATGAGVATITATAGSARVQIQVLVAQVPASMSLSASAASLSALGDTLRLTPSVLDSGGSVVASASVTWSTLDTTVARVDSAGLVTASGNGTTQVVAIAGAALASAAVTVLQTASAVMLSADSVALGSLGDTLSLSAFVSDSGGSPLAQPTVSWASSDTLVVKVSPSGLVTAVANGAALVTATSGSAVGQAQVVVRQIAASLTLLPDSIVLKDPGDTAQLSLTAWDAGGSVIASPTVGWTSADEAVATVDTAGRVVAVETGTVTVSADVDGVVAQRSVLVEPELTVVPAGPTSLSGLVATELSLSVRVEDLLGAGYAGASVTWAVAGGSGAITSGATVTSDPSGYASAVWMLGTASGAQSATASIESRGAVVEVTFDATALPGPAVSAALAADSILLSGVGETARLTPIYTDQYGNLTSASGVVWVARDPAVATVSADGLVTAASGPDSTWVVASIGSPLDSLLVTVELRGAITVTFDDGWIETYTGAFPRLAAAGLRGNVALNPLQVGFDDYLTGAQLDELDAAGWSVVSHSLEHDTLTTLSDAELDLDLRASQEWIDAHGYKGSNVFVVPFHIWGVRERNAIATYYDATRGTSASAFMPDSLVSWMPPDPYELTGIEAELLPYTTSAGRDLLRDLLQRAVDEGRFVDVFFHHIPDVDLPEFEAAVAVIDEFHDRVIPYYELYPKSPREVP